MARSHRHVSGSFARRARACGPSSGSVGHSLPFHSKLPHLERMVRRSLLSGQSPGTTARLKTARRQFLSFCDSVHVPQRQIFPSSEVVLCAFAVHLSGKMAGSTIRGKLSALRSWHLAEGTEWHGASRLGNVLKGVDRATPSSSRMPARKPITRDMLKLLVSDLHSSSGRDTAILAIALVSFFAQLRLGEILPTSEREFHRFPDRFPRVSHVSASTTSHGSCRVSLPKTKTSVSGEDVIVSRQKNSSTDPVHALRRHIRKNTSRVGEFLATYRDSDGRSCVLTKRIFLSRCNEIWKKHGLGRYTGHCFRIGGTSYFLLAGVNPDVVKSFGRWKSDSFLRYWRSLDQLAVRHLENLRGGSNIGSRSRSRSRLSNRLSGHRLKRGRASA